MKYGGTNISFYSSVGSLLFTVEHEEESVDSVKALDVRTNILKRLASLTDEDLLSAVELDDTVEEGMV